MHPDAARAALSRIVRLISLVPDLVGKALTNNPAMDAGDLASVAP
jgi:hypothetical protein